MPVYVCILTGKGYGAIGSILLYGPGAESILSKVFQPAAAFEPGKIIHGKISDNGRALDDVVIGCEKENQFAVHCHGNPVMVQKIASLFVRHGAQLTELESAFPADFNTLLEREAAIEQLKAMTIEGVKIIQSQINGGLSKILKEWLEKDATLEEIQQQCRDILERSRIARRIIHGVKIVLAGPANSGKSTLLNTLAGSQKAIVSEIAGTTRDWVSAFIHIGPLRAEVIDTAGLGENAVRDTADKAAQQRTLELIEQCDCVLWIEDCMNPSMPSDSFPARIPVIEVLNKSDLSRSRVPQDGSDTVRISAKSGDRIDALLYEIQKRLQVDDFDCTLPVAFTSRQEKILQAITESKNQQQIRPFLASLINSY